MEKLTDYAERMWNGEVPVRGLLADDAPTGVASPVMDRVAVVPSFANVIAFQTADGLVLVDTGLPLTAQAMFDAVRAWSADPVRYVVFTHGHVDHVFGVGPYDQEALAQGWPAPVVVAHEAVPARFSRYVLTAGYNTVVNRRQFGNDDLDWPVDYRYPDRTYGR
jgi:glyoxylase-like metal-dependent hydrolase (beta-lactamase superfamily II)